MNAAEQQATAWCSALFADLDDDLGQHEVTVFTLPNRRSRWLPVSDPTAIAAALREADGRPGADAVYLSMALARPGTPHTYPDGAPARIKKVDVGAVIGLWADIDVAGEGHAKPNLPTTEADALRILGACGLPPSQVWRSGGGLQAFWRLADPLTIEPGLTEAEVDAHPVARMLREWNLTLAMHAHRLGRWAVDPVHDLARVLRPPGTTNRKIEGQARRVELIEGSNVAYDADDFLAHTAERAYLDQFTGMTLRPDGRGTASLDLHAIWRAVNSAAYAERGYVPEWLALAIEEGVLGQQDRLVKVFTKGHESGDDSTTDASIARLCADLELDERDAVEMIMCRRLHTKAKVDKVDPNRRRSYLIMTVDKVFASARETAAKRRAGAEALAAQDAAAQRNGAATPVLDPVTRAATAETGPHDLGGAIVAALGESSRTVIPPALDDAPAAALPAGSVADPGQNVTTSDDDATATDDAPTTDDDGQVRDDADDADLAAEAEVADLAADVDPLADPETAAAQPTAQPRDDTPPAVDPPDVDVEPEPAPDQAGLRPITGASRSSWGTRTEAQAAGLDALSLTLLGKTAEDVSVWRCQYRGSGAKQERRIVLRINPEFRWPAAVPERYVPGLPLASGWYPAGSFDKLGGWLRALRQDCLMITVPVKTEDFNAHFGDLLVRLWEPDTSGGSLANVTREGLLSYLLDFPPMPEWAEASAQGMPLVIQENPRWQLASPFSVLVRWSDFGRHVRTHFAVNVTPPILADMAELSGAEVARTRTQSGRWRAIRRAYLSEDEWALILRGAEVADAQRGERHSMRVVPGGRDDDGAQARAPRGSGVG